MINTKLAEKLGRHLRERRGDMTQREFARKLGISQATLNKLENHNQNVTLKTLETIARRLRCDIGDLFRPPK